MEVLIWDGVLFLFGTYKFNVNTAVNGGVVAVAWVERDWEGVVVEDAEVKRIVNCSVMATEARAV